MNPTRKALLAVTLALAACAPEDVVLGEPHVKTPRAAPCVVAADCGAEAFCERGASNTGECRERPVTCDGAFAPVCGSNAVTYWNDCLRAAGGVPSSSPGVCETAAACGGPSDGPCPDARASCAQLGVEHECRETSAGRCWVVPEVCPAELPEWGRCDPGSRPECLGLCEAVHAQRPYERKSYCR